MAWPGHRCHERRGAAIAGQNQRRKGRASPAWAGSDPRITFEAAAKIYLERVQASPDFKPKTKAYHEQRLDAFFKSWPGVEATTVKDITKVECVEWRNRFAAEYSPTSFNHTLGIVRSIFEFGIEAGARRVNPAKAREMKRLPETSKRLRLPEPEFEKFVKEIENGGDGFSKPCAELVQFLAYGGFRITEAKHITWADCNFRRGRIIVNGEPEAGLKGRHVRENREVPNGGGSNNCRGLSHCQTRKDGGFLGNCALSDRRCQQSGVEKSFEVFWGQLNEAVCPTEARVGF